MRLGNNLHEVYFKRFFKAAKMNKDEHWQSQADMMSDRRRLKKSILRWRWIASIAALSFVTIALFWTGSFLKNSFGPRIVEVCIDGVISEDPYLLEALADLEHNRDVVGLILKINSPGGTMVGGETLYEALCRIGNTKPIVAELGTVAASGGYMAAIAADHIVAHRGTVTGSIGVIFQSMNFSDVLKKLGVAPVTIKSGPLKASPNPFEPIDDKANKAMNGLIEDMFDVFINMVADRRKMSVESVRTLADGRVYTGQQALENGLVDEIGGRRNALRWLEMDAGVAVNAKIVPLDVEYPDKSWIGAFFQGKFGKIFSYDSIKLDGLLAVWTGRP